jgi:hypothetical protein
MHYGGSQLSMRRQPRYLSAACSIAVHACVRLRPQKNTRGRSRPRMQAAAEADSIAEQALKMLFDCTYMTQSHVWASWVAWCKRAKRFSANDEVGGSIPGQGSPRKLSLALVAVGWTD